MYLHKFEIETPADGYIITTDEAKEHLHVSGEDNYVASLVATAQGALERELKRVFLTTEIIAYADCWAANMYLPYPKLQSVDSVKYFDINGEQQTLLENDFYWVVTSSDPGYIKQKFDATYPELQQGRPDAISITYMAGYGDDANSVPTQLKHAVKLMLTDLYEHRGSVVVGSSVNKIPNHILDLIHSFKIYQF